MGASSKWPRRVTSRSVGRVEPVFVTTVRVVWFQGRSSTHPSHSTSRRMGTSSCAVHSRLVMSSSICEAIASRIHSQDGQPIMKKDVDAIVIGAGAVRTFPSRADGRCWATGGHNRTAPLQRNVREYKVASQQRRWSPPLSTRLWYATRLTPPLSASIYVRCAHEGPVGSRPAAQ